MCWKKWNRCCDRINLFFEQSFEIVTYKVAKRPLYVIFITVFISIIFMLGYIRFRDVNQIEKLYIPQKSLSMKLLERANANFLLKVRTEEFVLKYKDNSLIFTQDIFVETLKIYNDVINIGDFREICIKNHYRKCASVSVLDIFDFDIKNVNNISNKVVNAYHNDSFLFQNGRKGKETFPYSFGNMKFNNGSLQSESVRTQFLLKYPDQHDLYKQESNWEAKYLQYMKLKASKLLKKDIILLYNSGRSVNDNILESSLEDVKLVSVSIILMIVFCTFALANFRHPINGHFLLGMGGILTLIIGISTAFGFVMLIGYPFIAFAGVLPFLVLGVGIDNIFIITNAVDQQDASLSEAERISKAMGKVGSSITMITITDLIAFLVSTVTDFPAIKYFCLYIAFSIIMCYLLVCSLFIGLLSIDIRRIKNERKDFVPCFEFKQNLTELKDGNFSNRMMEIFATFLMKKPVRISVIVLAIALLAASVYASLYTDQSFDTLKLSKVGSHYLKYKTYENKAFTKSYEINVICDQPVDYSNRTVQNEFVKLNDIALNNLYTRNQTLNWMTSLIYWAGINNLSTINQQFYPSLHKFLYSNPTFYSDLKFNRETKQIKASRVILYSGNDDNAVYRKNELLLLRHQITSELNTTFYPISLVHIYIEQFVVILGDTIRNIAISSVTILFIMLPYLKSPLVTFLVFFGFISLIFELLALMYIWNVSLNSLSMIIIVMAMGFAVDYSAHIAHAFVINKKACPKQRVIEVMKTMGTSVLLGGSSTFIGILVTAFASSEIFRIFFKMMFGIVVFGLLHGLVILPVLLATLTSKESSVNITSASLASSEPSPTEEFTTESLTNINKTNITETNNIIDFEIVHLTKPSVYETKNIDIVKSSFNLAYIENVNESEILPSVKEHHDSKVDI